MKFTDYEKSVASLSFGKRVADAVYIHRQGQSALGPVLEELVTTLAAQHALGEEFNIVKFRTREARISFLAYPGFFDDPHPVLRKAVTVDLRTGKLRRTEYTCNPNPPLLHRKETFLPAHHPRKECFEALTMAEEAAGLYAAPSIIGFKLNWDRLLASKGLRIEGHTLVHDGQACLEPASPSRPAPIDRHKTALVRYDLSKPVKSLLEYGILRKGDTFFDYGCGLGADIQGLQVLGFQAEGWDPEHRPEGKRVEADVVNLGYVLNVIEDPAERLEVLCEAYRLASRVLVVSALIEGTVLLSRPKAFGDGILTKRNTFQKYYEQQELQQYIEDALETTAVPVALGIFYVFRNPTDHQQFLISRTRRSEDWDLLKSKIGLVSPPQRRDTKKLALEQHKDLLEDFWRFLITLGRLPAPEEYPRHAEIVQAVGSPKRAIRILLDDGRLEAFQRAESIRKTDLLVYLASSNLRKRVPLKHLPASVRLDIRAFFGTYQRGLAAGLELLYSIGDADEILLACEETSVGWQDQQALYIHKSSLIHLPAILRTYVACGEVLYGNAAEADIIKLHKASGKLTFLVYDDFESNALPQLRNRIKVNLRSGWVQVFDHSAEGQLLYYKDRYLDSAHPERERVREVSTHLRALGIPDNVFVGPSKTELLARLASRPDVAHRFGVA